MTLQPGQQTTIATHILFNISRSTGNQAMKSGQLIEHAEHFCVEKSYTKCAGKTILSPFSTKSKLSFKECVSTVCLFEGYRNIVKPNCRPLPFIKYKVFLKNKKQSGTSFHRLIFCITFKEKYFSWDVLLTDQIPLSGYL